MQVVTLNPKDFDAHAARLAREVAAASSGAYDAIVAIRRGGSFVCDAFCRHFPKESYAARYDVTLQRPSTQRKSGRLGDILKRLPLPILDAMRMAESVMLGMRRRMSGPGPTPDVALPDSLAQMLEQTPHPEILLIDDAIDSGDTLYAIVETLRKLNPDAGIRIAVMTVTTPQPRIRPDFTLYQNRTLIRFPWSNDYKDHSKE